MATQVRSRDELIEIYRKEAQTIAPELTDFSEGSIDDALAGSTATALDEAQKAITDAFAKTFIKNANGPAITEGPDDLEDLAVDHYGDDFARLGIQGAVGIAKFTRPDSSNGDVTIPAGTIVTTDTDANGDKQRYKTVIEVSMPVGGGTELLVNASVEALPASEGPRGNIEIGKLTTIETALTDPTVVVTNDSAFSGGADELTDPAYREFIFAKIQTLKGATKTAIESAANNVAGVEFADAFETIQTVIEWSDSLQQPVAGTSSFKIPRTKLFIADANGTANDALIQQVSDAIETIRACGVRIDVLGAVPVTQDWTAQITLDAGGPNFATLSSDPQAILDDMFKYIQAIPIGNGFNKTEATNAILAIWGPAGSGDLVAGGFVTLIPSGTVVVSEETKLLPGTLGVS